MHFRVWTCPSCTHAVGFGFPIPPHITSKYSKQSRLIFDLYSLLSILFAVLISIHPLLIFVQGANKISQMRVFTKKSVTHFLLHIEVISRNVPLKFSKHQLRISQIWKNFWFPQWSGFYWGGGDFFSQRYRITGARYSRKWFCSRGYVVQIIT